MPLRASAPEAPVEGARCKIAASQQNPLVTEWPASEKANLEVRLRGGGVAVAYSGCEMRLLPQCPVGGAYAWQRTTPATDGLEIRSEDELYAKLPLGAAALEGELRASGRLSMQTTVAGQLRLMGARLDSVRSEGPCAGATHVVAGITVGAFKLKSGGALSAGAQTAVAGVGVSGSTSSSEVLVREAGVVDRCGEATDQAPHGGCSSPIQMFLQPLPDLLKNQGPPGTVKVNFLTGDPDRTWEVVVNHETLCETPCTRFISPSSPVLFREKDPGFLQPAALREVPPLRGHAAEAPLDVIAHSRSNGPRALAITFTALGGAATATGITLTAAGCASESAGVCTAGLITAPIGLGVLAGSIWLLVNVGENYDVQPAHTAGVRVRVGPGFATGQF